MGEAFMERPDEMMVTTETPPGKKRFKLPPGRKKYLLLLPAVLAVGIFTGVRLLGSLQAAAATVYQEETVAVHSITNALTGSSTLQPADSYTVTTLVSGEILSDTFYVGQSATIFINGFAGTTMGIVTAVSSGSTASSTGRMLTTVRVRAENPGLITSDHTATAVIGSYSSYGSASIKVSESSVITAGTSGKISGLRRLAGDTISSGDRICTITGDTVDSSIENARISPSNSATSLENAQDNLDDYEITALISGAVVTKSAKAGDNIEGGSDETLCTIYDLSYLEMTLNVDELDISDVEVGQTVTITADAVEDTVYTGVVTNVSVAGNTSGGITTYPVTIRIDETDGLRPGMNVDAEIVISSAEDVLAVPRRRCEPGRHRHDCY